MRASFPESTKRNLSMTALEALKLDLAQTMNNIRNLYLVTRDLRVSQVEAMKWKSGPAVEQAYYSFMMACEWYGDKLISYRLMNGTVEDALDQCLPAVSHLLGGGWFLRGRSKR